MGVVPDAGNREMAGLLVDAAGQIDEAIGHLGSDGDRATAAADAAIQTARQLQHAYYQRDGRAARGRDTATSASRAASSTAAASGSATIVIDVAERIVYAVVKES